MAAGGSSEARLRAVLGDAPSLAGGTSGAWAEGYGIVAPDVERYVDVLQPLPDPVALAMRNVAAEDGSSLLDSGTTTLLRLLAHSHRPAHVLEVGTGLGQVTLHLARAVPDSCVITSIDPDPIRQGQAHAFLQHDPLECAVELRLGNPLELLDRDHEGGLDAGTWDFVVLPDPEVARLDIIDAVASRMSPGALLIVPWALRGGRVADGHKAWDEAPDVDGQRSLNRGVAMDARFADVVLLPVGDGLLLARRTS